MVRSRHAQLAVLCLAVSGSPAAAGSPDDSLSRLTYNWRFCVDDAARNFYVSGMQKPVAVENAFVACRTEEQAIFAALSKVPRDQMLRSQTLARAKLKASLVRY